MASWTAWVTISFLLTLLYLIFQTISNNQAKTRMARFKLEQRRKAGIPDSDHRPFNLAQQDAINRKKLRLQNGNGSNPHDQFTRANQSHQLNQREREREIYPLLSTPSTSRIHLLNSNPSPSPSAYHPSILSKSASKPSYAQLHLSRDDQQGAQRKQRIQLELQNQREREKDPYNPKLQSLPQAILSTSTSPNTGPNAAYPGHRSARMSNKRSRGSASGDQGREEDGEQAEEDDWQTEDSKQPRSRKKTKARRVEEIQRNIEAEREEGEEDEMEWDASSEAQQHSDQEDAPGPDYDEMEIDQHQVTSRGKKREIDDLSNVDDVEDEEEEEEEEDVGEGSKSSLLNNDELEEIPIRRNGAITTRRLPSTDLAKVSKFSPRKKHKRAASSIQPTENDDSDDELQDEEMKSVSVSTFKSTSKPQTSASVQSPFTSPSKRKLSTSNDRKPGDVWTDAEGLKWTVGQDSQIRRLAIVRSERRKYPNMPKDSLHPDKDAMETVYLEKYLTHKEYEEARQRKELGGQEFEREETIKEKARKGMEEREKREREEIGRKEGRRVKALGRESLGSQSLFHAPSSGTPLRSGTPTNLARSLLPESLKRDRSSTFEGGPISPPHRSGSVTAPASKRLSLGGLRTSSPSSSNLASSTSSASSIQISNNIPATPTLNSGKSVASSLSRSGSLLLGVRRTSLNAQDKKRREEELKNKLAEERESNERKKLQEGNKEKSSFGPSSNGFNSGAGNGNGGLFNVPSTATTTSTASTPNFHLPSQPQLQSQPSSQPEGNDATKATSQPSSQNSNLFSSPKPSDSGDSSKLTTQGGFSFSKPSQPNQGEASGPSPSTGGFTFGQANSNEKKNEANKAPSLFGNSDLNTNSSSSSNPNPAPSWNSNPNPSSNPNSNSSSSNLFSGLNPPKSGSAPSDKPSFSFTSSTNKSTNTATGSNSPAGTSTTARTFTFGSQNQTPSSTSTTTSAPSFTFGNPTSTSAQHRPDASSTPSFSFGNPSANKGKEAPKFNFNFK